MADGKRAPTIGSQNAVSLIVAGRHGEHGIASALHENFYENDMVADEVSERLDDVEALVDRLLPLLIQT